MSSAGRPGDPDVGTRGWSTLTLAALILAGLGLVFAPASGIGLPFALAGTICAAIAIPRDRRARPWPLIALVAGLLGTLLAAVLVVVAMVTWGPLVPGLLLP
ncbi:hypothetical protein [Agrococcus sp. KRD186]|uniref:hypothetical protein n=1 Tax=Agrococcus sp. KRD186 TaxID=2729730 RepID=UPI0019D25253|nr:hypothetical protein [Agrococcus sp. KRD186]